MTLHAFTDGASRGNPGESGIGALVKDEKGNVLRTFHGYIGVSTNNKAEYTALITLLERMDGIECEKLIIHSDSELMVRQLSGRYKVRDAGLKVFHRKAAALLRRQPFTTELRHVPREQNHDADRLANLAINTRSRLTFFSDLQGLPGEQ
jgi:ribonuclease HI